MRPASRTSDLIDLGHDSGNRSFESSLSNSDVQSELRTEKKKGEGREWLVWKLSNKVIKENLSALKDH